MVTLPSASERRISRVTVSVSVSSATASAAAAAAVSVVPVRVLLSAALAQAAKETHSARTSSSEMIFFLSYSS